MRRIFTGSTSEGEYQAKSSNQPMVANKRIICSRPHTWLKYAYRMVLDAGSMGNKARFINHSCDPNCQLQKWSVNGELRLGIFAVREIDRVRRTSAEVVSV